MHVSLQCFVFAAMPFGQGRTGAGLQVKGATHQHASLPSTHTQTTGLSLLYMLQDSDFSAQPPAGFGGPGGRV